MHTFDELQNMTDQRCKELVIDFVTYLPFRAVQFFQTSLSIASIPLLVYVVKKYIFGSTIHFNVKIIFIMYYLFAIGHALINTTMQIYQTIRSMLSQPCLAFPTRVEYETFNLCLATMTIGMVTIQFSIFCERALATFCVHNYEKHSVLFGFMFCTLAGVLIAVILFTTYRHKDFDELTASMLNTPTAAAPRINRMFIILGAISVAAIVGMQILLRINRRKGSQSPISLSSRYQTQENMFVTQFATWLSSLQVTIYVLYSLGGLAMRAARPLLFGDDEIAWGAARAIFYLIPLFTFLLPLVTIILLRKYKSERQCNIKSIITMKSTGIDGMKNYQNVIDKAWRV